LRKAAKKNSGGPKTGPEERKKPLLKEAEIIDRVGKLAEPLCEHEGMELVHVEYHREPGGRILRIYIDKPGGVHLEDCAGISRQLGDLLDVYLDEIGPYNLEVSSPGPDRPLGKTSDFERFKGCRARIRTHRQCDGRRNFIGELMGISEGSVVNIRVENKTVAIPFPEIQKARLINFNGEYPCL
jgi:ribosome maturation factor RimP